jgi:uncharacterized protein
MSDTKPYEGSPPNSTVVDPRLYVQGLSDQSTLWRALAAVIAGLGVLGFVFLVLLLPVGNFIDRIIGKVSLSSTIPSFTIGLWLAGNLGIASFIPASIGIERLVYGRHAPRLHSITSRFRWRLLGRLAVVLIPIWAIFSFTLFVVLQRPVVMTSTTIPLLIMVFITVPFQAAGEEYLYRGLISRAVGSLFTNPRIAIWAALGVSGLLFMLSHGNADPWSNAFYVSAAIGLSLTAHVSKGLEASALIHALTNVSFFVPWVLTDSLDRFGAPQSPSVVIPAMGLVLTMPLLVALILRRLTPTHPQDPKADGEA